MANLSVLTSLSRFAMLYYIITVNRQGVENWFSTPFESLASAMSLVVRLTASRFYNSVSIIDNRKNRLFLASNL